jgi:hypothetical protein
MTLQFKKATREKVKVKIGITGPAGSGKTDNALAFGRQLVGEHGRIACIDTENESASLYGDLYDFDALDIAPPYTSQRYMDAIDAAVAAGYDALVIDSISHQWEGSGGILDRKTIEERRSGPNVNGFALWQKYKEEHRKFVAHVLHAPIHIIACMRSRHEYVQSERNGKKVVEKLGMAPITGEGMEFEFSVVFDLNMQHIATATKDRTGLFDGQLIDIRIDRPGVRVASWLQSGATPRVKVNPLDAMTLGEAAAMKMPKPNGGTAILGECDTDYLRRVLVWARSKDRPEFVRAAELLIADREAEEAATSADEHESSDEASAPDVPDDAQAEPAAESAAEVASPGAVESAQSSVSSDVSEHSITLSEAAATRVKLRSGEVVLGECEVEQLATIRQLAIDKGRARLLAAVNLVIEDRVATEASTPPVDEAPLPDDDDLPLNAAVEAGAAV